VLQITSLRLPPEVLRSGPHVSPHIFPWIPSQKVSGVQHLGPQENALPKRAHMGVQGPCVSLDLSLDSLSEGLRGPA